SVRLGKQERATRNGPRPLNTLVIDHGRPERCPPERQRKLRQKTVTTERQILRIAWQKPFHQELTGNE
ncbi:MAG: hypothetical protein ACK58T_40490, partial [Phycisphaerae bacterium]